MAVERTAVNPWTCSVEMGFDRGEIFPGPAGDMAAQLTLSLDNPGAVLGEAGMSLANLVRPGVYITDVDLLFQHYGVLATITTLLGVTRLAIPTLTVEFERTAVA